MKYLTLFALAGLAVPAEGNAAGIPGMTSYFDQRVSSVEQVACTMKNDAADPVFPSMVLADVNVDFSPTVTFGITSVAGLSISPEVDLIFTPPVSP
jgi:hypothetical protein